MRSTLLLLAEDDPALAAALAGALRDAGFAVNHLARGDAVVAEFTHPAYAALLLDLGLPGADGNTVLAALRAAGDMRPVLVLTARDAVGERIRTLDGGADDYLCKPFAAAELVARVRALLRRDGRARGAELRVADLHLNLIDRRATRGDTVLALTAREFDLLALLAREAGTPVDRNRIVRDVWQLRARGAVTDAAIEVHVSNLRRKLDPPPLPALLHTLRGVGYLLSPRGP